MIPRSDNIPHVRTGTNYDTLEIRQWLIEISNNAWCTPPSRMLINASLKFLLWNRIIDDTRIGSQIDCVAFHTVRLFRNTSNYCILLTIIPRRRRRFFSITGTRKINRIVFSAGKFNRIRCQTHTKIACGAIRCTKILTGNLHQTFRSNLHQNFTSLDLHQKFRSSGEIVRLQREATDQLHAP